MRVLEADELWLVSGGNGDHTLAKAIAVGWGTALAGSASGFLVGSTIGPVGNFVGAVGGLVLGAGAGVAYYVTQ